MNVLVFGGNGFIGSHIVDIFISKGHKVSVFDNNYERFREIKDGVTYFISDFSNLSSFDEALDGVDIVIHAISTTIPSSSNNNIQFDIQSNLINTVSLLQSCVKNGIKRVIYLSSGGAIYGEINQLPVNEKQMLFPSCSYGIVKLSIERYLHLFYHMHGLTYNIIRPSNPFGPRQNPYGQIGSIAVFLGKIYNGKIIEIWGDGSIERDYIYVEDLANAIYLASVSDTQNEIFNIGSGFSLSLNQLLNKLSNALNKSIHVNYTSSRLCDVPKIYLDCSLAKETLKWETKISINEGILKTWDFVKNIDHAKFSK